MMQNFNDVQLNEYDDFMGANSSLSDAYVCVWGGEGAAGKGPLLVSVCGGGGGGGDGYISST